MAFCSAQPVGISVLVQRRSVCSLQHTVRARIPSTVRCAAHPPRRVGNVAKDLRDALQKSLGARRSRLAVRLPFGAKLGTEVRNGEDENFERQRIAGDREVARLISGMFDGTGLAVTVVFSSDPESAAATKLWRPMATCGIISWTGTGKQSKANREKKRKKSGFGETTSQADSAGITSNDPKDADVLVAVGGGAPFLQRVRSFAQSVGMDKLVITANANSADDSLPVDLARFFDDFEQVYYYHPDPSPKWSGGVLFRKFPDGM